MTAWRRTGGSADPPGLSGCVGELVLIGFDNALSTAPSRANASCSRRRMRSRETPSSRSIASSDCCSPPKPAKLEDPPLELRERLERSSNRLPAQRLSCLLDRIDRLRIREEIAELAISVHSDGLVQRHGSLDSAESFLDVLGLVSANSCELLHSRLTPMLELELAADTSELDAPLVQCAGMRIVRD